MPIVRLVCFTILGYVWLVCVGEGGGSMEYFYWRTTNAQLLLHFNATILT